MNGSNDFRDAGTDEPAPPVHWSLWKYEELYDWLPEVVKYLPDRDEDASAKAILTTGMALTEVHLIISNLQVNIDPNDITPSGYGNECLIKKMQPVDWTAIRNHLAGNSPMTSVNDQPARISAPESYM